MTQLKDSQAARIRRSIEQMLFGVLGEAGPILNQRLTCTSRSMVFAQVLEMALNPQVILEPRT